MTLCYYDYESASTGMSGWAIFLLMLLFVWGILQIILFFKIWGMTTDVGKILKSLRTKDSFVKYYLCGNYDEAYNSLNQSLYQELCSICEEINISIASVDKCAYFEKHRNATIAKFQKKYERIQRTVPERFHQATFEMIAFDKFPNS